LRQLFARGWRLWRSNPVLFYRRAWSFARSPIQSMHEIVDAPRRYERIRTSYRNWLRCPRSPLSASAHSMEQPLLSVIMPVHNTKSEFLTEAINSMLQQTYERWELCIADDASTVPHIRPLLEGYAAADARIRVTWREEHGHIAEASNSALAAARGKFIVLLDHDDRLARMAMAEVAKVIEAVPMVDFIYSDEDKLDFDGERIEPFFKPAWSPNLLTSGNYITHLSAMRRELAIEVGGFRHATVGSQDYDLFLRVTERARSIAHIPQVLYSWRKSDTSTAVASVAKPYAIEATRRALEDAIDRRGLDARLEPSHLNGLFFIRQHVPRSLRVSLIVLGEGDDWQEILPCRRLTLCDVFYLNSRRHAAEVPVVEAINEGTGDYLVWIDATARPNDGESVTALLEQAHRDRVGVVGGMTLQRGTGETLQAGIIFGNGGQPYYAYKGLPAFPQRNFYLNLKGLPREASAAYMGCCAMRREIWQALEGGCPSLPLPLAMCDLNLRALVAGYDNLFTPLARFDAREALDPFPSVVAQDWAWSSFDDPFWNPNLTPQNPDGLPFRCSDGSPRVRQHI
jgi:glycosyltransferase involved in cell wall biosynthesis